MHNTTASRARSRIDSLLYRSHHPRTSCLERKCQHCVNTGENCTAAVNQDVERIRRTVLAHQQIKSILNAAECGQIEDLQKVYQRRPGQLRVKDLVRYI